MPHDRIPRSQAWFDQLVAAGTAEDVVRVAREYLATWTPSEISALPPDCRPPRNLKFAEEVVDYAFSLVRANVNEQSETMRGKRMKN